MAVVKLQVRTSSKQGLEGKRADVAWSGTVDVLACTDHLLSPATTNFDLMKC